MPLKTKMVIFGEASKSVFKTLQVLPENKELTLMDFLRTQGVPVASSCLGEGVCSKCTESNGLLTCQIMVEKYLDQSTNTQSNEKVVRFDYL